MTNDLHEALFAHLSADVDLTALLEGGSGIVDAVPKPRAFPFVFLVSVESTDRSTDHEQAESHTLLFQIWSRGENRVECAAIADRIEKLLVDEDWSAPNTVIVCRNRLGSVASRNRQSRAFATQLRIRLITEPKT